VRVGAILFLFLFSLSVPVAADNAINVAVASNFTSTAKLIATRFHDATGVSVQLSSGSTGKLYAQIVHGAPYHVFLAADVERPRLLEHSGMAVTGSRFTYAVGSLVVYSISATDCLAALGDRDGGFVAIANPLTSPYGKAARQYLEAAGLWGAVSGRAAFGENISQTLQFAATGNASIGIVARSHLRGDELPEAACLYEVPGDTHEALEQQAVLLDSDQQGAAAFLDFLRSEQARRIIVQDGYGAPE
jgi:molybdate transport system substrate-binding protein